MTGGGNKGGTATRLMVLLLLIVPAALLAYVGYQHTDRNLTAMTVERRDAIAQLSATALQAKFDRLVDVGVSLASRPAFREDAERGDWDSALARVVDVPSVFPEIERLVITSATATVLADTLGDPAVLGRNFAQRDWFHGVSKAWEPYVSEVYKRTGVPQKNVVSAAVPVRGGDGAVIAILVLQLPLERFFDWSADVDVGHMGLVYYVDQYGHLASHPDHTPDAPIVDYASVPAVQRALAGERGTDILPNPVTKQDALVAWARVPKYGWGVVLSQDVGAAFAERDATLRNLLARNLAYLLLILLAALALMRLLTHLDRQLGKEKAIQASMGEGLAVMDREGRITYLNPAGAEILHLSAQDAVGRRWMEAAGTPRDIQGKPIPEADRGTTHALKDGKTSTVTYRYTRLDGTEFVSVATTSPIIHEGRRIGAINVFQDITAEVEVMRQRQELLSIASHQMRTPLTSIRWIAEMLMHGDVGKVSRAQKRQLENLLETARRMGGLVNDMLNVSRLEAGKLTAVPAPTDLAALLKRVADEIKPLAAEKKQKLAARIPARLPKLMIDGKLVGEAVTNLLSNAVKYTPDGGTVTLSAERRAKDVQVTVRDTGMGIPKAQQGDVFRKFFRAANAVKSGVEGTGLGLYVVKEIAELSGGSLTFESKEGEGTAFTLTLPLPKA